MIKERTSVRSSHRWLLPVLMLKLCVLQTSWSPLPPGKKKSLFFKKSFISNQITTRSATERKTAANLTVSASTGSNRLPPSALTATWMDVQQGTHDAAMRAAPPPPPPKPAAASFPTTRLHRLKATRAEWVSVPPSCGTIHATLESLFLLSTSS